MKMSLSIHATNFIRNLDLTSTKVIEASNFAAKATANYIRKESRARLASELNISPSVLSKRFRQYTKSNGEISVSRAFIGLNELGIHRMGTPIQRRGGVEINGKFYEDAFIQPLSTGKPLVFRRLDNKKLDRVVTEDLEESFDFDVAQQIINEAGRIFEREFTNRFNR